MEDINMNKLILYNILKYSYTYYHISILLRKLKTYIQLIELLAI